MSKIFEIDKDFRGNAYIVQNGETICSHSSGYADIANRLPNTFDTRFACASMSKTFVAVGILHFIEKGRLSFNDALKDILDMDLGSIDPEVTVRQLLTHTSGIPDYDDESTDDVYELWSDHPNYRIRKNINLFEINPEKEIKKALKRDKNKIYFYKINLKKGINSISYTNSIFYDNQNKTLPLGQDLSTNILIDISRLKLKLRKKATFKILNYENEKDDFSKITLKLVYVLEYDIDEEENY